MRLFDIDKILENLLEMGDDWVDSETGEILSYHEIELLEMERSAKIEGWGCWIKNQMSDAAALKAEIENMQARLKALNTKIESSTRRYQEYLNGEKVSTPKLAVTYRKAEAVEVDVPVDELPAQYQRIKTTVEPDKTALKAALKAGEEIAGCHLVTRQSMSIK